MDANKIIDELGGTGAVTALCEGTITKQAVSSWRKKGIPRPWVLFLREKRPDVFEPKPVEQA